MEYWAIVLYESAYFFSTHLNVGDLLLLERAKCPNAFFVKGTASLIEEKDVWIVPPDSWLTRFLNVSRRRGQENVF